MATLILFAAALGGGFIFPWWWPAIAGYAVGFRYPRSAGSAFVSGFGGTAMAWAGLAAFLDQRNHHLLSGRMSELFHLPGGWALILATGIIGGLIGGIGAWAGQALRAYVKPLPPIAGAGAALGVSATGDKGRSGVASDTVTGTETGTAP